MIHQSIDRDTPKGWFVGPWNSKVPVSVGYANEGVRETHYHAQVYEVYLIARGTSVAVVQGQRVQLGAGDMLAVEPGEVHTFVESSPDYFHFVLQAPFVPGDKVIVESAPSGG